ncbi:unnamed protein product [Closterium sp. NIES-53]
MSQFRLHLSFDLRANFCQVPSAHVMYSAVIRRYSPPPLPATLGCLALPRTFPALSDFASVADEGGGSGAGESGGGGQQQLESSCVATCAPTSTGAVPAEALLSVPVTLADPTSGLVSAHPSDSFGSTKGGDPAAADSANSCRSPRLETPPGFPPRTSSPPLQPIAVDFRGPSVVWDGDAEGAGFGSFGAGAGGVPGTGGPGVCAGGAGSGGVSQSLPRRPIFLEQPSSPLPGSALHHLLQLLPASVEPTTIGTPPPLLFLAVPDPVYVLAHAASPTIPRCLAAHVTAHVFLTATASVLVAELAGLAVSCRCAYLVGLFSASSYPPSVGGELALGFDVLEDRLFELEYLPYPLSIRTRYVTIEHWRAARRVLCYLVRLARRT